MRGKIGAIIAREEERRTRKETERKIVCVYREVKEAVEHTER